MAVPLHPDRYPHRVVPTPVPAAVHRRVADLLVDTLLDMGVDTFYGIPGGALASLYDALLDRPEARVINVRHETAAAYMAIGHFRTSGKVPCVLTTAGPGITNVLTGIAAAQADGIPLICIGGEVPKKNFGRGALQEGSRYQLDVLGMVRSLTKFSAEVTNPRAAVTLLRKAVATAQSGRQGPVFLSLPLDVASEQVQATRSSSHVATRFDVDHEMVEQAVAALQRSKKGLILVGSGARHPDAARLVGTLASALRIPVATTPKAKGLFPETDPLSLGVFGLAGHVSATRYVESGIDVLLCVGCGLGEGGTNSWTPLLQAKDAFIQIDIDAAQIGRNYHVDVGLVGPSHVVLNELLRRVRHRSNITMSMTGIEYYEPEMLTSDKVPLQPARVINDLQKLMPPGTTYTSDIGEHLMFASHYLKINEADAFIVSSGLGAMGSGIGAAIGAKVADPSRAVLAICGDYGFQMHGMELATCVQEKLGVVFAIFNDARMGMVHNGQSAVFGRPGQMSGPRLDFAALAQSMGAYGYAIRKPSDFNQLPHNLGGDGVPVVLDIAIDPASKFSANGRVAQIKNFNPNA